MQSGVHRFRCGLAIALLLAVFGGLVDAAESTWKAGTAKRVVTPQKSIWMAGYGSRTAPAEGKQHDLLVRALAIEDAEGHR